MTAFRFRLQRVLRVRAIEERIAGAAYREAARAAESAEARARSLAESRVAEQDQLARSLARSPLSPGEVLAAWRTFDGGLPRLLTARERQRTLDYQAGLLRAPWEELRQARRSLERLRERKLAEHELEEERKEIAALDAVASERARRLQTPPAPVPDGRHDDRS